jgi:hypothetical protein
MTKKKLIALVIGLAIVIFGAVFAMNQSSQKKVEAPVKSESFDHSSIQSSMATSDSEEAAKIMSVADARAQIKEAGIDDAVFTDSDIIYYILESHDAGQTVAEYMKMMGIQ